MAAATSHQKTGSRTPGDPADSDRRPAAQPAGDADRRPGPRPAGDPGPAARPAGDPDPRPAARPAGGPDNPGPRPAGDPDPRPAARPGGGSDNPGPRPAARPSPDSVKSLTDPRALRALAHPIRLALLGLLRTEGPLTATRAGELLGESSASCSFHLRQLAKYGLAEEASGGHGRERPWQATAMLTHVPEVSDDPELAAAADALRTMIAERYFESLTRWLEVKPGEPDEWRRAAQFSDRLLYLTAAELADLSERMRGLVDEYLDRTVRPELRPAGARLVNLIRLAFPLAGQSAPGTRPPGRPNHLSQPAADPAPEVVTHDAPAPHRDEDSRPAAGPGLPSLLERPDDLHVRGPDLVHRITARRRSHPARQTGPDGHPRRPGVAA